MKKPLMLNKYRAETFENIIITTSYCIPFIIRKIQNIKYKFVDRYFIIFSDVSGIRDGVALGIKKQKPWEKT